ncbi:MAG: UTP--glucose-1-phosphate uridylyltransferase [Patescibacteria group bacterium]|nr:UTP--glucose-1-phosphate uridylyltransferase [Patescibacteria group bacterium]
MKKIKKAIVAVAGSGTRLLPATKAMPKEMLPIVDKPVIQLVVEELVEAGIEDIILVTKWDKKPLEDHFDKSWALENELEKGAKIKRLKEIKRISNLANFIYVRQKGPYGSGTPALAASNLVKDEPFVFAWGDDLVKSKTSFTKQMIKDYEKSQHLMIGVQEVPMNEVSKFGIVKLKLNTNKIIDIIEKPSTENSPGNLADFGRMILNQDIINILRDLPLGKNNELQLVDAIRKYIKKGGDFYAKKVEDGEWLTTGDPLNLIKTILKYAMDREDLRDELKNYFQDNYCNINS